MLGSLVELVGSEVLEPFLIVTVLGVWILLVYVTCLAQPEESKPMVRAGFRTKLALKFPPFAVQARGHALIVAGGGGDSKTGVPNQIVLYRVKEGTFEELVAQDTQTKTIFQINFHPTKSLITCSVGCECWIMEYSKRGFRLLTSFPTLANDHRDAEQKTSMFVGGGKYLLTAGSNGRISVFELRNGYTHAEKLSEIVAFEEGQLKDTHASNDFRTVIAVGKKQCKIWRVIQTNRVEFSDNPFVLNASPQHDFSGARLSAYGPIIYTAEILPRKLSVVKKWRFDNGPNGITGATVLDETVVYKGKHHTSFDMSACGRFLALGSPTGEVAVVSTASMAVIALIQSHGFTVTNVALSVPFTAADFTELATNGSGDNTTTPPKSRSRNRATPTKLDFDDLKGCYAISCALDRGLVAKSIERNKIKQSSWWLYLVVFFILGAFLALNFALRTSSATSHFHFEDHFDSDTAWPNNDQL